MFDQTPFRELEIALQKHISSMVEDSKNNLFTVDLDKDILWNLYLNSFPEGTNPVLKTRTEHDCNACKHFIRAFGNVVLIKNNIMTSIWDFQLPGNSRYNPVLKSLAMNVKHCPVEDVFYSDSAKIGTEKNLVQDKETGQVTTWEHLFVKIPDRFVPNTRRDTTLGTLRSQSRANRDVFKRSLEEISPDAVQTVLELIAQNSLYKGEEWQETLKAFQKHQKTYSFLTMYQRELYTWEQSLIAGPVISKIRNHSIGVLLVDITNGMDLDEAVRRYEKIVAPSNYKRPKAIFTKKMLEDAKHTLAELGYLESLGRRFATLEDISVRNTLFVNRDARSIISVGENEISPGKIFQDMKNSVAQNSRSFSRVEEVPIQKFISDILPHIQKIEVLVENRHASNFVSLIAPQNSAAPSILKWNNGFSWAYKGNMTDSMKERVKALGGSVEGVLRFSIQWNEGGDNLDDLDAHCVEPDGNEIYFINKRYVHPSSGVLDVDIVRPENVGVAVENITYSELRSMPDGTYKFFVRCFSHRNSKSGFTAEVEFDGQIHSFAYNQPLRQGEKVQVAEVNFDKKSKSFSIKEKIPSAVSSRKLWGLDTQQFHEVSVLTLSPNYWNGGDDDNHHVGNKHYFFMLRGCTNDDTPNGFFNEYLKEDLLKHKRVFEALGTRMQVTDSPNGTDPQLSGLGFSSTQRNNVVVKVTGQQVERLIKIIF